MCATKMNIPDSITVNDIDSIRMVLTVPRGSLTGDSLAPQQLKVYRLTRQLPSDINSAFDPDGYYDPSSPLGVRSYTLSALSMNDSLFKKQESIRIPIMLPKKMARGCLQRLQKQPRNLPMATDFRPVFPRCICGTEFRKRLYRRDFIHEILHLLALHETGVSEKRR